MGTPDNQYRRWVTDLYDQHAPALFRYAVMVLADVSAAEDVVQDVFTTLWTRPKTVADAGKYLWAAVRNQCYSALRTRLRHPPHDANGAGMLETVRVDADPSDRMAVERALRAISPEQREVIHLKMYEGRTFEEIATLLDEPLGTVTSRYRYGIAKLRELLGGGND